MKRNLLLILYVTLLPLVASAYTAKINGIYYNLDHIENDAMVTYNEYVDYSYSGTVVIPKTVTYHGTTYRVMGIDDYAFSGCSGLTSVTIPSSVFYIGKYAFYQCYALEKVIIPDIAAWCSTQFADSFSNPLSYAHRLFKNESTEITDLVIPNSVTRIPDNTFSGCSGLKSVTIPNNVTSIGDNAFRECSSLTSVTIGNSVTSIGWAAFIYCSSLTSVTIPNSVTSIGDYAFNGCRSLTSLAISNSVTSIEEKTFSGCNNLTTVTIGNSVTRIPDNTFSGCSKLATVTIGNGVTSIGDYAFYNCTGLTNVYCHAERTPSTNSSAFENSNIENATLHVPANALNAYKARDPYRSFGRIVALEGVNKYLIDGIYYSFSGNEAIVASSNTKYSGSVVIPASVTYGGKTYSVTSIGESAFSGCGDLTSITIPNSVTAIGDYAFQYCTGLTSITIPGSVSRIGNNVFYYCSNLKSVLIENPFIFGNNAFSYISSECVLIVPSGKRNACIAAGLTEDIFKGGIIEQSVQSPDIAFADARVKELCIANWDTNDDGELCEAEAAAVTDLGEVFKQNKAITSFNELQYFTGLTRIGDEAFLNCRGLTSITISNSVTCIGNYAFCSCIGLTSIIIPNSVTSIDSYAFSSCIGLTSIIIPNSVTSISDGAFQYCKGLISITIPNSVASIGSDAFRECSGLKKIIVPDIAAWCNIKFSNYYSNPLYHAHHLFKNETTEITNLVIPNSVTNIESGTFSRCNGLTSVTIPNSVISIGSYAFEHCTGLTKVIVPDLAAWCNIRFNGSFANPLYSAQHLFKDETTEITDLVIPQGVTSIGNCTFAGCRGLKSVTIPNYVTSIGEDAFEDCSGLTKVIVPDLATWCYIKFDDIYSNPLFYAHHLFKDDTTEITNLVIPNSVTSIGDYAFDGCSSLTSVTIPNSVTSIGSDAFYGCSGLTSITIPSNVATIGRGAFRECSGLTKVIVPDLAAWCNIKFTYNSNPLYRVHHLFKNETTEITDLVIPESVTNIGDFAFTGCSGLTSVTIPNSVTSIGEEAFSDCSGLTSLTLPSSVATIGKGAFRECNGLTSVTIPNSVTSIGSSAFSYCTSLTDVICYAEDVPNTDVNAFYKYPIASATLHVPASAIEQYKATEPWSSFGNIVPITEDDVDGIEGPTPNPSLVERGAWFDLNGRRVANPGKGLYIKNGKKVAFK